MTNRDIHPARFVLERLHAEELREAEKEPIIAHLQQCLTCQAYVDHLAKQREALLDACSPLELAQELLPIANQQSPRHSGLVGWFLRPGFALTAAAAAVVAVIAWAVVAPPIGTQEAHSVRLMGNQEVQVTVLLKRNERVSELQDEQLQAGDGLRFQLHLQESRFVALLVVDSTGHTQPLIPTSIEDGALQLSGFAVLPGSVAIEAGGSVSRLFLVARKNAFDLNVLARQIEQEAKKNDLRSWRGSSIDGIAYTRLIDLPPTRKP